MKQFVVVFAVAFLAVGAIRCSATNYYISPDGHDESDGRSPKGAWASLAPTNDIDFEPGDTVVIFPNEIAYKGSVYLTSEDSGEPGKPVVFLGIDSLTCRVGQLDDRPGIYAYNVHHVVLRRLQFEGRRSVPSSQGIYFYTDKRRDDNLRNGSIVIDRCRVNGFGTGIMIGAYDGNGFDSVSITNSGVDGNIRNGLFIYGSRMEVSHRNVTIFNCAAIGNSGDTTVTDTHTGSGIMMSSVDNGLIEKCHALGNGASNRHLGGGPVGIWMYECRNSAIRSCMSGNNKAGADADGGGFDIDGGCSHCVIEYCYSFNNEGNGLMFAEFGSAMPFTDNIIRYCISINDAGKNHTGGILLWGVDADHTLKNSKVYNNTIVQNASQPVNPYGVMLSVVDNHMENVEVFNNAFYTAGPWFMDRPYISSSNVHLFNNHWHGANNAAVRDGTESIDILTWIANNAGQESSDELRKGGFYADPQFLGLSVDVVPFTQVPEKIVEPSNRSPLINTGVLSYSVHERDYRGDSIVGRPDVGAIETSMQTSVDDAVAESTSFTCDDLVEVFDLQGKCLRRCYFGTLFDGSLHDGRFVVRRGEDILKIVIGASNAN